MGEGAERQKSSERDVSPDTPLAPWAPAGLQALRKLGSGGFGSVYEVQPSAGGVTLALKRLERVDAESIYRFKQEFRVLSGKRHPNLVRLHELYADGELWAFSMDLVQGVPFDVFVRGGAAKDAHTQISETTQGATSDGSQRSSAEVAATDAQTTTSQHAPLQSGFISPEIEPEDIRRLRRVLPQLVRGVLALHEDGILHRDLKPSNVLVSSSGELTILDFGLALSTSGPDALLHSRAGTPTYMSPEQARGGQLTMASDWYSVGVMLYEALLGHPPFAGTAADVLSAKRSRDPRDPRVLRMGLPDDLVDLAMSLLRRDPKARPNGFAIARRLGVVTSLASSPRQVLEGVFVGREKHLRALQTAYDKMREGELVVAHVQGRSGLGKTTLVRHFVTDLALRGEVVVLEGRCFERESVPFKAVDDLVDALGRYLSQLKPLEAAGFMPRDAQALVRLFPSLGRLSFLSAVSGRAPVGDAYELRRRAFAAFREILTRLSDTRPVVLVLEDVHWGDRDSAELIRNLLAPPDVPPLLLVATARPEMVQDSELLRILRQPQAMDFAWEVMDVDIAPLSETEAIELAKKLLEQAQASRFSAEQIAEEAARSPLLIAELVRAAARAPEADRVTMRDLVHLRRSRVAAAAIELLDVLSACDRPIAASTLAAALQQPETEVQASLAHLCDEHLASVALLRGKAEYEIFHDRIRRTVIENVPGPQRVSIHARLAEALRNSDADPEIVFAHYIASGQTPEAADFAEKAADRAMDGTAFEQATELYRVAMNLLDGESEGQSRIRRKLARAAAQAGRGAFAAQLYTELSQSKPADQAVLVRLAGVQYLRAGMIREGLSTLESALKSAGLSPPRTPTAALTSLLYRRARLRMRGLGIGAARKLSPEQEEAIDLCWALGNGLTGIDVILSAHYHTLGLWLALESADRSRIARVLSLSGALAALESAESADKAEVILSKAEALVEENGDPHALGWLLCGRALQAWTRSEILLCVEYCEQAVYHLRERSDETFREIGSVEVWFHLHALFLLGRLDKVAERAPACAREAEVRGDRYTESTVRAYVLPLLWAARGQLDEARRDAERAIEMWPVDAWYHQHWAHLRATCFLDLYERRGERIRGRTSGARPKMKAAMHLRLRTPRLELNYLEGRGALDELLLCSNAREANKLGAVVEERIRRLEDEHAQLASVYAAALQAGLSTWRAPSSGARVFARLAETFAELGLVMHQAAALYRQAELEGLGSGRLVEESMGILTSCGVRSPLSFIDLLVPRVSSEPKPDSL